MSGTIPETVRDEVVGGSRAPEAGEGLGGAVGKCWTTASRGGSGAADRSRPRFMP